MASSSSYIANSFIWGAGAKIFDAGVKFVSLPLLLLTFGKDNFGLITLAIAANAYMNLLDLGINTGAVKYFAEWISKGEMKLMKSVANTSITFYCLIGLLNAIILISFAEFGLNMFAISDEQVPILRSLFLVLAMFSVVNWSTSVFIQLLTANESISYMQKVNVFKSLMNAFLVFYTITVKISLIQYFLLYTLLSSLVVIPFYIKVKREKLLDYLKLGFDWINFSIILKYSLSILAIGVFQVSATALRPIILSIFTNDGVGVVTDFRILETITLFIISIGGMFSSIFLPRVARLLLSEDSEGISKFAYATTRYTSIICVCLCLPFILNSTEIIFLYVGNSYEHLSKWLIVWTATILMFLHSTPVNSILLAKGKIKTLVYITALSCTISLIFNALFSIKLGAGAAVIGYSLYIGIQMSFYYFYYYRKNLGLNPVKLFQTFFLPTVLGFICLGLVLSLSIQFEKVLIQILLKSFIWFFLYIILLLLTNQVSIIALKSLLKKK